MKFAILLAFSALLAACASSPPRPVSVDVHCQKQPDGAYACDGVPFLIRGPLLVQRGVLVLKTCGPDPQGRPVNVGWLVAIDPEWIARTPDGEWVRFADGCLGDRGRVYLMGEVP